MKNTLPILQKDNRKLAILAAVLLAALAAAAMALVFSWVSFHEKLKGMTPVPTTCASFSSFAEAMDYWDLRNERGDRLYPGLDGDGDDIPCDALYEKQLP